MASGEANVWQPRTTTDISGDTKSVAQRFIATASQVVFNITKFTYALGTGAMEIHKNGLLLVKDVDWVEVSNSSFNLIVPATILDEIVATAHVAITGAVPAFILGDRGNPHIFSDLSTFVNGIPYSQFKEGDWIQMDGRTVKGDGRYSLYEVTVVPPTFRRNYENYIPLDVDGDGASLFAVLIDGFQREFREQAVEIIAHRGFANLGVENTLSNFSAAMQHDVQALEGDIQVTSDGNLVMFHDDTLDADTNGSGAISANTFATVQALIFDKVAGTYLSNKITFIEFNDFVVFAKSVGARIYPEIKDYRTIADIQPMVDVIELHKYEEMTVFQSFDIDDLVEVRRINNRVGVGWLTTNINSTQENIDFDKLQKLKWADVLHQDTNIVLFPTLVDKVYDAGLGLAVWGATDNNEIKKILGTGVTRVMIDQPQLIASVRGLQNVNY